MKEIVWEGNSRAILRDFPDGVRRDLGTGLMYLQVGAIPTDTKPFKTGMPGTWELRSRDVLMRFKALKQRARW